MCDKGERKEVNSIPPTTKITNTMKEVVGDTMKEVEARK